MPYQEERNIPPFNPPLAPDKEENLLQWAQDLNTSLVDYFSQIETVFNLHIRNEQAHPAAWDTWKIPRPHYKYYDSNRVIIPASANAPVYLSVRGKLRVATSDLYADLSVSGVGGLNDGVSRSANNTYYLYGVVDGDDLNVLIDDNSPNSGPNGYDDWTYIGAFITDGSGNVPPFMSHNGFYKGDYAFSVTTGITSSSFVQLNLNPFPDTAHMAWIRFLCSSNSKSVVGYLSGRNSAPYYTFQVKDPTGSSNSDWWDSYVPLYTPKTVYARISSSGYVSVYCYGWVEDPTRWK